MALGLNALKSAWLPAMLASLLLVACTDAGAAEGDASRGQLLSNQCQGCHNIQNYSIAFPEVYKVPRIQRQTMEYIQYALQEYASGTRYSKELNRLASMPAIASSLTEQDIADLAAFYASQ